MFRKFMTAASVAALMVAAVPAVNTAVAAVAVEKQEQTESERFNAFLQEAFMESIKVYPEFLSRLRILDAQGITDHNGKLNDMSGAAANKAYARDLKTLLTLKSFDDEKLSEKDKLNKRLAIYEAERSMAGEKYRFHDYPINQLFGWHTSFPSFMTNVHRITSKQDAEYYIARLNALQAQYAQLKEGLELREAAGVIPPKFVFPKVIAQIDAFADKPVKENVLYSNAKKQVDALEGVSDEEKAKLLMGIEKGLTDSVLPSYADLKSFLERQEKLATTENGVWKLPDGEEYYNHSLAQWTTTKLSAKEIHATGLSEVDRIQAEMLKLFKAEGYDTKKMSFSELINGLAEEDRHYYPDTEEGREQILIDYKALVDEIDAGLADQFNIKPKAALEVKRVPAFQEKGAPGGYYNPPAADGSRPGMFFANLYDIKGTAKYGMRALAFHEGVPGHHYQIALQQEQTDLPMFRKFGGNSAYIEGWALYSERVAYEMGFQPTNLDKIGALQSELFRAVRLVVDTGIHAKRWTREEAIDYMANNTGMAMSDVVTEIERYIVLPGQATTYKVGQLKILELRNKARKALRKKYDPRDFHDVILKGGSVPLAVLEEQVDKYIADKKKKKR